MGRKKPGEPRRSHVRRQYTLRELAPPGAAYREWYQVRHGTDVGPIDDPRLRDEELDLPRRTARLGPLYENAVPRAAIGLDLLIDNAALPVVGPDGTGTSFPVENLVSRCRGEGPEEIHETVHRLHAAGVLLAEEGGEHGALRVRMVAERPGAPRSARRDLALRGRGGRPARGHVRARRHGGRDPPRRRGHRRRPALLSLPAPDAGSGGGRQAPGGERARHARELLAAAEASGHVDEKGCDACPAAHLCARGDAVG
ncbi:hypothetical protein [Streptomyces sp. NPDC012450]|uniref:hypothetical protein n=1 Tax=Streptomyces sp. NPDC012450 TaxID=3364834 RepID=UPI0036E942C0